MAIKMVYMILILFASEPLQAGTADSALYLRLHFDRSSCSDEDLWERKLPTREFWIEESSATTNGWLPVQGLRRKVKVGLALSGGGDRGIAHIGVLKAFEKHNIPIDGIAGTSMGAIVGGLYACGYPADSLESMVLKGINWDNVFSDHQLRQSLPLCERLREKPREPGLAVNLRLSFNPPFLRDLAYDAAMGLREAQGFTYEITRHTLKYDYRAGFDFDSLPIPFGAIVVNMKTQNTQLIRRGTLATACRASGSLPIVFEPMNIGGVQYVDGGVLDDLPVDAFVNFDTTRAPDCAITIAGDTFDYIIAVYTLRFTGKKDTAASAGFLGLGSKTKTAEWARDAHVRNGLKRADTGIEIDVLGKLDFSSANMVNMISKGYESACSLIDKIKNDIATKEAMLDSVPGHQKYYYIHTIGSMEVEQIDAAGEPVVPDDVPENNLVSKAVRIGTGSRVSRINICDAMKRIYGLGDYEQVSVRIENPDAYIWNLSFQVKKKRVANNKISINTNGMRLDVSKIKDAVDIAVNNVIFQKKRALNFEEVKDMVEFVLVDCGFIKPRVDSVRFIELPNSESLDTLYIFGDKGIQLKRVEVFCSQQWMAKNLQAEFRMPFGFGTVIRDLKSVHEEYSLKTIAVEDAAQDRLLVRVNKKSSHTLEFPSLTFESFEGINFFAEIRARQWVCWTPYLNYAQNFSLKSSRELPQGSNIGFGFQDCDAKSWTPELTGSIKRLGYPSRFGGTVYDRGFDRYSCMLDLPFYIANKFALVPGIEGGWTGTHMVYEPLQWQRFQVMGTAQIHWDNLDRIVFPQRGFKASCALKIGYLDRQPWERVKIKTLWPLWNTRIQNVVTSVITLNLCGSWYRSNTPEQERFSMGGFTPPGTYQLRRLDYEDLPGFPRDMFVEPIMWKAGGSVRFTMLEIKLLDIKFKIHMAGALNLAKATPSWNSAFNDLEQCPSVGIYADLDYVNAGVVVNGTRDDLFKYTVWYFVLYGLGF